MNIKMNLRTKAFGLQVIELLDLLPNKPSAWVLGKQVARSATSIGANYRAAFRAKSTADFINKLKIVEEEADESIFWLELLEGSRMIPEKDFLQLKSEVNEILAIVVTSIKTARSKL